MQEFLKHKIKHDLKNDIRTLRYILDEIGEPKTGLNSNAISDFDKYLENIIQSWSIYKTKYLKIN